MRQLKDLHIVLISIYFPFLFLWLSLMLFSNNSLQDSTTQLFIYCLFSPYQFKFDPFLTIADHGLDKTLTTVILHVASCLICNSYVTKHAILFLAIVKDFATVFSMTLKTISFRFAQLLHSP